jgi:hypothetical protein
MRINIPELLAAERSLGVFVLVTVVMGGGAAWLAGRATAAAWRPWWHLVGFMLILALAVRFIHFAVFDSKLLSLHYYLVDAAVCLLFGWLGFRLMRATQMATRYSWINERAGPFRWRRRGDPHALDKSEQA